jgi:hypothetical protein
MISAAELRAKAQRRYAAALKLVIEGNDPFPLLIPYARPKISGNPAEVLRQKEILRRESKEVAGYGPTVEFKTVNTRRYAAGVIPGAISFTTLDDLVRYVDKKPESARILRHAEIVAKAFTDGRRWAATHVEILAGGSDAYWQDVCKAVEYFRAHPKPFLYARELPIGLHTKFLEDNHKVVISLLEAVSGDALNEEFTSWQDHLGLRSNSTLIEGRFLDPDIAPGFPQHMSSPIAEWNRCQFSTPNFILVVENRTTFLALPFLKGCLALQGMGYAVALLAEVERLKGAKVYYWGDIDQHGFEILATFRSRMPHVQSLLMDEETVERFSKLAATETVDGTLAPEFVLKHLTVREGTLWRKCVRTHFRVEQEHLPLECLSAALVRIE